MFGMRDLCVELINKLFGILGFVGVIWHLIVEVFWPPYDLKNVSGQTVLIVGVNALSRGLARRLAKRGARLVFWDGDADLLDELNTSIEGVDPIVQLVDLTSYNNVKKAAKALEEEHHINVDIIVNAYGTLPQHDWLEEDAERVEEMIDTNFKSVVWVIRQFLPAFLQKRSGHIVTIGSTSGVGAAPHICEYSASKFAVVGYMKAIEVDTLARGITGIQFTTLNPSHVQSGMMKEGSFSGKSLWMSMETDEVCDRMLEAMLTNRRTLIMPWQDSLLYSFQLILSQVRFHEILARRWQYSTRDQLST